MTKIHPTAVVEDGARLGSNVTIGAFSLIGPDVVIGDDVVIHNHASIAGHTTIGSGTAVHPFASIGGVPQSVHYRGDPGKVTIGEKCIIRENVTISMGLMPDARETTVGDRCFIMAGAHIAHDCHVGNDVIMANYATLAGHVSIGNNVFLGGLCALHQFVRVGDQAIIGGLCPIWHDVIPFGAVREGAEGLGGLNIIGMKRRGFERPQIRTIRAAYRDLFYGPGELAKRIDFVADRYADDHNVMQIIDFVRNRGRRRLTVPRGAIEADTGEE